MDLVEIVHLDGEVRYRRARSPLGCDADLWLGGLSSCESQYPTEIHDQIQSKNVGVKSLGILDMVRCNIGHDALYRPAGLPTLYPGTPNHSLRRRPAGSHGFHPPLPYGRVMISSR
jgi:hypothetical protein